MRKRWKRFIDWLTGQPKPYKPSGGNKAAREFVIERSKKEIEKEIERQEKKPKPLETSTLLKGAAMVLATIAVGAGLYFVIGRAAAVVGPALLSASPALAEQDQRPDNTDKSNRQKKKLRPGSGATKFDQQPVWQIVKLPNMGGFRRAGIYSIRRVSNIERGIPYKSFRHAGKSRNPVRKLQRIGGPTTRTEAAKRLAAMIEPGSIRRPPLAGGRWGKINGQTVTIDDYGPVSISELQRHMKKKP